MTTATLSGGLPVLSSGAAAPLTGRNRARAYIICTAVGQRRNRRSRDGGLQPVTIVRSYEYRQVPVATVPV